MAPGISFGHFNIVGGDVREDGPYVGVIEDRAPAESIADLYLVLEPALTGSEPFCPELLKLIEGQFGRPQYSLTGNLLQALRAAQEHLRSWNRSASPSAQAAVGATCLAVCGEQAYLAQIGPGLAYLRHDGLLHRVQAVEPEAQAPLGTSIGCSPDFSRFELSQGDSVLLVSSRFASLVNEMAIDALLSLPPAEALPEIYKVARHQSEFSALYLAVTGELRRREIFDADEDSNFDRRNPAGSRRVGDAGSSIAGTPYVEEDAGPPGPLADQFALTEPKAQLSAGWFTKRRSLERLTDRRPATLPRPALYTFAALLSLALVGWLGLPRLLQTGRQDRFESLIQDASKQEASAAAASSPADKRVRLSKVQGDLIEARTLRPQDAELARLDAQLTHAMQTLDQVLPLPSVTTVADLTTTAVAAGTVTDMVAVTRLYILDGSTGRVYSFNPGSQSQATTPVFESGMVVEGIQTGAAAHLAVEAGGAGHGALVYILDGNRRLFTLDESGTLRASGLAAASTWKGATAMAVSGGDLYILDRGGNQIWRYAGGDAGFTATPVPLLVKADLHDAAHISVCTDIYVSTLNGQLLHFSNGRQEAITLSGIDHPLRAPQPPVADLASDLNLVADPGNQRIVVTDSKNTYHYQYASAELQGLRSIAVDPTTGLLYALTGQKLISSQLH